MLEEYDAERRAERRRPSKDAEPLPPEGTAIAMQLEVVADAKAREENESTAKVATALAAKAKPGERAEPPIRTWAGLFQCVLIFKGVLVFPGSHMQQARYGERRRTMRAIDAKKEFFSAS